MALSARRYPTILQSQLNRKPQDDARAVAAAAFLPGIPFPGAQPQPQQQQQQQQHQQQQQASKEKEQDLAALAFEVLATAAEQLGSLLPGAEGVGLVPSERLLQAIQEEVRAHAHMLFSRYGDSDSTKNWLQAERELGLALLRRTCILGPIRATLQEMSASLNACLEKGANWQAAEVAEEEVEEEEGVVVSKDVEHEAALNVSKEGRQEVKEEKEDKDKKDDKDDKDDKEKKEDEGSNADTADEEKWLLTPRMSRPNTDFDAEIAAAMGQMRRHGSGRISWADDDEDAFVFESAFKSPKAKPSSPPCSSAALASSSSSSSSSLSSASSASSSAAAAAAGPEGVQQGETAEAGEAGEGEGAGGGQGGDAGGDEQRGGERGDQPTLNKLFLRRRRRGPEEKRLRHFEHQRRTQLQDRKEKMTELPLLQEESD